MSSRLRTFRGRIALIAAAGLAVRLAYVFGPAHDVKGFGDFYLYHWGANLIADGHWFVEPFLYMNHGRLVPSAVHPPLWELMLAGVSWLGGTSFLAHRAFGCLLGAITIFLVGLLGRRIGGDRVGVVAAALAAVYPVLIAADGSLMTESLYGMLITAALLLALELREKHDVRIAAALGAVIALAALTRSEALILVVLLALPVALVKAPPGGGKRAAACLAAAALVLTPWIVREWVVFDRPVLISTNFGPLLAGANCDTTYRGKDIGLSSTRCYRRTIENEAVQAARWRNQATDYMVDHAGRVPFVVAVRVLRTWDLYQPWRMTAFAEARWLKADKAGVIAYYLLLPFALAGGWLIRKRRAQLLILLAPVAVVFIATAVGYGFPRFRHAADIVLVVLAAVAVGRVLEKRRTGLGPATALESRGPRR